MDKTTQIHLLWASVVTLVVLVLTLRPPVFNFRGRARLGCPDICAGVWGPLNIEGGASENPLWRWFVSYEKGPVVDKWMQYFDVYHRYMCRFRKEALETGRTVHMLEIGVQSGGSIKMWQSYFGKAHLQIYGVDINEYAHHLFHDPDNGVHIIIGDQSNRTFWRELRQRLPPLDIVLDDGGHSNVEQITTFEELFPHVSERGVYIVEDTLASYSGGTPPETPMVKGSWIDRAKSMVDDLYGHYIAQNSPGMGYPSSLTKTTVAVAFYDQMVVMEKGPHPQANSRSVGSFYLPYDPSQPKGGFEGLDPAKLAKYKQDLELGISNVDE